MPVWSRGSPRLGCEPRAGAGVPPGRVRPMGSQLGTAEEPCPSTPWPGCPPQLGFCAAEGLRLLEMPLVCPRSEFCLQQPRGSSPGVLQHSCSSAAGTFGTLAPTGTCSQSLPRVFPFPESLPALAPFSCACPSHLLTLTQLQPQVWVTLGWLWVTLGWL